MLDGKLITRTITCVAIIIATLNVHIIFSKGTNWFRCLSDSNLNLMGYVFV